MYETQGPLKTTSRAGIAFFLFLIAVTISFIIYLVPFSNLSSNNPNHKKNILRR